jgi:hypothetical protein
MIVLLSLSLPLNRVWLRFRCGVGPWAVSRKDSKRVMSVLILLVHSRTCGRMYSMNDLAVHVAHSWSGR